MCSTSASPLFKRNLFLHLNYLKSIINEKLKISQ
uniref:Uncharacterized protein n=1 Tax=Tetranychus urticae TaxID=32264 RepID=T1JS23_TETUR